jgi:hypothetical protein
LNSSGISHSRGNTTKLSWFKNKKNKKTIARMHGKWYEEGSAFVSQRKNNDWSHIAKDHQ